MLQAVIQSQHCLECGSLLPLFLQGELFSKSKWLLQKKSCTDESGSKPR